MSVPRPAHRRRQSPHPCNHFHVMYSIFFKIVFVVIVNEIKSLVIELLVTWEQVM